MNFDNNDNDLKQTTIIEQQKQSRQQAFIDEKTQVMPRELLERAQQHKVTAEEVLPAAVIRRRRKRRTIASADETDYYDQVRPVRSSQRGSHWLRWLLCIALAIGSAVAGYIVSSSLTEEQQALEHKAQNELQQLEEQKHDFAAAKSDSPENTAAQQAVNSPDKTEQPENNISKDTEAAAKDGVHTKAATETKDSSAAKKAAAKNTESAAAEETVPPAAPPIPEKSDRQTK